uniref:LIM zinc-binding domain-containing protein n=1 Tax=Canis lupus dingo TaxID=286419 RepID=A0A8C0LRV5_CANLU
MNPQCARCGKVVYPTEKVNCLDKYWHKGCFHCEVCKMALNMNNYKGYEKKPYCNAHYPKQSFTTVADTPENLRLKQQSELQSQVTFACGANTLSVYLTPATSFVFILSLYSYFFHMSH